MNVKVGVIIPSYNQGKYIEKTIQSVIENKQNVSMDIAVIDGGSTDETVEIIKRYEEHFAFWCSEPDKGQADAINKGIAALKDCDYYLWLNSDDVYEDACGVKKIVEYAVENKYEVCYGLSHFIDETGEILGTYPVEEYSYENLGKRCFLSQPSVMFSKKAYLAVGPLNESLRMCLDYEYWIRLAQKFEFGFIKEFIGATRMYGDTKTSTMQKIHLEEAIGILWKYYGDVPMHWLVTKVRTESNVGILKYIPARIFMFLLRPFKKKMIKDCINL